MPRKISKEDIGKVPINVGEITRKIFRIPGMTVVVKLGKPAYMQVQRKKTNTLKREITLPKIACLGLEEMEIP